MKASEIDVCLGNRTFLYRREKGIPRRGNNMEGSLESSGIDQTRAWIGVIEDRKGRQSSWP